MYHHYDLSIRIEFTPGSGYRACAYRVRGHHDPFGDAETLEFGTLPDVGVAESFEAACALVSLSLLAIRTRVLERWGTQESLF